MSSYSVTYARVLFCLFLALSSTTVGEVRAQGTTGPTRAGNQSLFPPYQFELSRPSQSASDIPATAAGRSLFDRLFARNGAAPGSYDIPFPFSRLVEHLESHLGDSINDDANRVKYALFPLGRCINRYAASPDFYRFPRVVLAVDSEHVGKSFTSNIPLKDRLFLGYQENAGLIDVISYNNEAGRFDFQTVTDYGLHGSPVVRTAPREDCIGCHQNEGPIFPQSPYRETDNNPALYRKILEAQQHPVERASGYSRNEIASVDGSINRANMFTLFQTFWRSGCRADSPYSETRCRAGLLETVLRVRLADSYRIQTPTRRAAKYLVPIAEANVRLNWPSGIAVHSSDIPSLDPLALGERAILQSAELINQPRSERIFWRPGDLYRIVQGLGDFIPRETVRRLDQLLYQTARSTGSSRERIAETCGLKMVDREHWRYGKTGPSGELSVSCHWPKSALSAEISFFADFRIVDGEVKGFPYSSGMAIGGSNFILSLAHRGSEVTRENDTFGLAFDLFDSDDYLRARMPDGRIIGSIELRWSADKLLHSYEKHPETYDGRSTLTLYENLRTLDDAISALVDLQDQGLTDVLSDKPFDAESIMQSLFSVL